MELPNTIAIQSMPTSLQQSLVQQNRFGPIEGKSHPASHSLSTLSTASSGVPGIGYLSGKTVKWTGTNILKAVDAVVILKRQHFIKQLATEVEALDADDLAVWLVQKERKLSRAIGYILELSS